MSSFINQNRRKWLDEANASNITSTPDDGGGSSICIERLYSSSAEEKREGVIRRIRFMSSYYAIGRNPFSAGFQFQTGESSAGCVPFPYGSAHRPRPLSRASSCNWRKWSAKATSGVGAFVAGLALDWIRFPRDAQPGEVPPDVLFDLGLLYGPLLMVLYLMALGAISFYRITRSGHDERVAALSEQEGA